MHPVRKPTWQQATALVSLSTCGAMTGFAFAHGTVDDMTSPTRMPVHLMALNRPVKPVSASDSALRSAIVNVAGNYLRMAQDKSPAEMEAIIWGNASVNGVDHGQSCAAFASLTLALGAQATGQHSWVSGGTTYPWPLHQWADVRVDLNPASPGVVSIMQDAQANHRWHPLGDGYQPQPGDWVMFDGHVEVVTGYSAGALHTIGGDSAPNLSVNAHTLTGSLAAQGVSGFVNNGELLSVVSQASGGAGTSGTVAGGTVAGGSVAQAEAAGIVPQGQPDAVTASAGQAAVPGTRTTAVASRPSQVAGRAAGTVSSAGRGAGTQRGATARKGTATMVGTASGAGRVGTQSIVAMPGVIAGTGTVTGQGQGTRGGNGGAPQASAVSQAASGARAGSGTRTGAFAKARKAPRAGRGRPGSLASIPGLQAPADIAGTRSAPATPSYTRNNPPSSATAVPGTTAQQAFISEVAPGAMAAQSRYGIPAAVTIAQAIDESGWGQSALAITDHNLFGIKGSGPAGTDMQPTREYQNGQWVTVTAPFRVYHNVAESIADHSQLLATGPSYQHAMADRHLPDAFATDLTGVYATDPQYGSNLMAIMRLYNLYRYGAGAPGAPATAVQGQAGPAGPGAASQGGIAGPGAGGQHGGATRSRTGQRGAATIPGVLDALTAGPARTASPAAPAARAARAAQRPGPRVTPRRAQSDVRARKYVPQIPHAVTTAFLTTAKAPLTRAAPLYDDVASRSGIRWELLAACDWMQCQAQPRYSPVYGEKLGTVNAGGTVYRTKSEALAQCAGDLVELAMAVYWIDITARRPLSVRELAKVFAAFRWGGLLTLHNVSAMELPYSVEGLTAQHVKMRWPDVKDANAPDRPGSRFRMPFGAVPVVLSLGYPAIA